MSKRSARPLTAPQSSVSRVHLYVGISLDGYMFPPGIFRKRRLKLVRQHTYASGVIELRYERAPAALATNCPALIKRLHTHAKRLSW